MWYWQRAIAQPALLQALLCATASHQLTLNTVEGVPTLTFQNSAKEFLRLRGDALKTLNGVMRDPMRTVAESTILVISSLVAIEVCQQKSVIDSYALLLTRFVIIRLSAPQSKRLRHIQED
jgi:hypothetical protein